MALIDRLRICIVVLTLFTGGKLRADEWQESSRNADLTIYFRHRSTSPIEEIRVIARFDVPILDLKAVLEDVAKYPEFMPYTKESRVLSNDSQLCYMLWTPPLVEPRDCTIRVHRETLKRSDGGTNYYSHWEQANEAGPSQRPGIVRMTINDGSWLLEPIGNETRATYTLYTDGGDIPPQLANLISKQGVLRLFNALRARAHDRKQRKDRLLTTSVPVSAVTLVLNPDKLRSLGTR